MWSGPRTVWAEKFQGGKTLRDELKLPDSTLHPYSFLYISVIIHKIYLWGIVRESAIDTIGFNCVSIDLTVQCKEKDR